MAHAARVYVHTQQVAGGCRRLPGFETGGRPRELLPELAATPAGSMQRCCQAAASTHRQAGGLQKHACGVVQPEARGQGGLAGQLGQIMALERASS